MKQSCSVLCSESHQKRNPPALEWKLVPPVLPNFALRTRLALPPPMPQFEFQRVPAVLQVELPVADVAGFSHPVVAQVLLKHEVPGLDVTALGEFERDRLGRCHNAIAQIGSGHRRQTAGDGSVEPIGVRGRESIDAHHWISLQRVAAYVDRFPRNAIAGADDQCFRPTVRDAKTRRKKYFLLMVKPQFLG